MRTLRIAYFAEIFPSKSETWIHHEIIELQKLGCEVRVFATHPKPDAVPPELQHFIQSTVYLPELDSSTLSALARILKSELLAPVLHGLVSDAKGPRRKAQILRDLLHTGVLLTCVEAFQPDFLFAHFAGTRTNLAMFHALLMKVPFGFKMHASDVFERVALFRLKVSRSAKILTISNYNLAFIKQYYPDIDVSRFEKHACGIPLESYHFQPSCHTIGEPCIIAVGRLVRTKGFDVLLQASRTLLDRGIRHKVTIIGDGPEREPLEHLCRQLALLDIVSFEGYLSPRKVRHRLLESTLLTMPAVCDPVTNRQDGIPVALMEAMALGIPVVSTKTSGIPELIEDGVTGFLALPNDPSSLAAKIVQCCQLAPNARGQILLTARRKVEQDHNVKMLTSALWNSLATAMPPKKKQLS